MQQVGDGCPQVVGSGRSIGVVCYGYFRFLCLVRRQRFGNCLVVGIVGKRNPTCILAFETEVHTGGRQTVLVVACSVCQVSGNVVFAARQFVCLDKGHLVLHGFHLHHEHRVLAPVYITYGFQVAYRFHTGALFQSYHGSLRTSIFKVGAVNVPSAFYRTLEGDLQLSFAVDLLAYTELYGLFHLGHTTQGSHNNNK